MPRLLRRAVSAVAAPTLTLGFLAGGLQSQAAHAEPWTLSRDQPQDHELEAGESHQYRLPLEGENYLYLMVEQKGIDVAFSIQAPDGRLLERVDGPGGPKAYEVLVLITEDSGDFVVKVKAPESGEAGSYRIWIDDLRPRRADDELRVEAEKIFTEGLHFEAQGTGESRRQAIERFRATLPYWKSLGDQWAEAFTRQKTGYQLRLLGDMASAKEELEAAVSLWDQVGDSHEKVNSLNNLGLVLKVQGEFSGAYSIFERARVLAMEVGSRRSEIDAKNNLGLIAPQLGDLESGIRYLNESLAGSREIGDLAREGIALANLGDLLRQAGKPREARSALESAISILTARGRNRELAYAYENLALVEHWQSRYSEAIRNYQESLSRFKSVGDRPGEGTALENLASFYVEFGQLEKASDLYRRAADLYREIGSEHGEVRSLAGKGHVLSLNSLELEAIDLLESLVGRAAAIGDPSLSATVHDGLGRAFERLASLDEASSHCEEAMRLRLLSNDRNSANLSRVRLADLYLRKGDLGEARTEAEQAFKEALLVDDGHLQIEATTVLARIAQTKGQLGEALRYAKKAISIGDTLRRPIGSPGLRVGFFGTQRPLFELAGDVLFTLHGSDSSAGFDSQAFAMSEHARARVLVDSMAWPKRQLNQVQDLDLIERQQQLLRRLSSVDEERRRARDRGDFEPSRRDETISEILEELDRVDNSLLSLSLEDSLRRDVSIDVDVEEVQKKLDSDTLLLEFLLGEERSFVWAISREKIEFRELAPRRTIEEVTRQIHWLVTERNRIVAGEHPTFRRQRVLRSDGRFDELARTLAAHLLSPISQALDRPKVLIVADGALHFLPFSALPLPETTGDERYWVESSEIAYLPAASLLLNRKRNRLQPLGVEDGRIAVLADPVFDPNDPRLVSTTNTESAETRAGLELLRGRELSRLPFTRVEAEKIIGLAGSQQVLLAMGSKATKDVALRALGKYRIVHFATHGILDTAYPSLSSIVLSLYSGDGVPTDGFLRLQDLYSAEIRSELVVLSGCETALGMEARGEGLVGLTWGFLYGGADSVVSSLWEVPDRATAELMSSFYQGLFESDLNPSDALREAQRNLIKIHPEWASPYYWASFVPRGMGIERTAGEAGPKYLVSVEGR